MHKILSTSPLFAGLDQSQTQRALEFYDAFPKHYNKGDMIHTVMEPMKHFGLVLSGSVQVQMDDLDGYQMILANVGPGGVFGESLCFLEVSSTVYIVAVSDCDILWLNVKELKRSGQKDHFETDMTNRFVSMIAQRSLAFNDRIQILSKSTLRSKLITLFSQYAQRAGDSFTLPFDRESMASYLGVNRSALSRELSAMRKEGIISYRKSIFTIHHNIS